MIHTFSGGQQRRKLHKLLTSVLFIFLIVLAHAFWLVSWKRRTKALSVVQLSLLV